MSEQCRNPIDKFVERDKIYTLTLQIHDRPLSCLGIEEVTRIRKSKDKEHNGKQKMDKMANNGLQNITHKTTD